ncbi:colanic acid biosynthesis glycosyl transferase WcaI [Azospirillaceae bacterium]
MTQQKNNRHASKTPSLLFINRVFPPNHGASGRVLADLAERCARSGWRVTVLTDGPIEPLPEFCRTLSLRVIRTGSGSVAAPDALGYIAALGRLLWRGLRLEPHDAVVSLTDPPFLAAVGAFLAFVKRSAAIHWSHDLHPHLFPTIGVRLPSAIQAILTALAVWIWRRQHCVIAIGRCMAARLRKDGVPTERIRVLPNWPDPSVFPLKSPRCASTSSPFVVAYSGNFGLAHPLSAVLDAAAILEKTAPDVRFLLIGNGRGHPRVEQALRNRPLASVSLLPWRPAERLAETLAEADLHVATLAQDAEGLMVPCKVASALAAGRPCVFLGPSNSEAARIIRTEECGLTLAADDGIGLAEAILTLRNDVKTWSAMAERATQTGRIWTADRAAQIFLSEIAEPLLARKKRDKILLNPILNKN